MLTIILTSLNKRWVSSVKESKNWSPDYYLKQTAGRYLPRGKHEAREGLLYRIEQAIVEREWKMSGGRVERGEGSRRVDKQARL